MIKGYKEMALSLLLLIVLITIYTVGLSVPVFNLTLDGLSFELSRINLVGAIPLILYKRNFFKESFISVCFFSTVLMFADVGLVSTLLLFSSLFLSLTASKILGLGNIIIFILINMKTNLIISGASLELFVLSTTLILINVFSGEKTFCKLYQNLLYLEIIRSLSLDQALVMITLVVLALVIYFIKKYKEINNEYKSDEIIFGLSILFFASESLIVPSILLASLLFSKNKDCKKTEFDSNIVSLLSFILIILMLVIVRGVEKYTMILMFSYLIVKIDDWILKFKSMSLDKEILIGIFIVLAFCLVNNGMN
jgi:hypothetical protein